MNITNKLQKIDSIVFGNYIIKHYGPMSHLKLQKLLFYCDAYHLAYFDAELMEDRFEAWVHGPVSRKVFDSFRDKSVLYSDLKFSDIETDNPDPVFDQLTDSQKEFITEILTNLTNWADIDLETATHKEEPWLEAREGYSWGDKCNNEISKETMKRFYKKELNG